MPQKKQAMSRKRRKYYIQQVIVLGKQEGWFFLHQSMPFSSAMVKSNLIIKNVMIPKKTKI